MEQNERYVPIGDSRLFVVERGTGFPVVVLHGGPGLDHTEFGDYLDPLTDHYRLVLVDQRAQGRSDVTPPSTWTLAQMAADVTALGDALGYGPYAVLGHSYGAFVALQQAVDFPGLPAGTIVSGGVPSAKYLDGVESALASFEPEDLRAQVAASWAAEETVETPEEFKRILDDQMPFHFADPRDPRIADYNARTAGMVTAPAVLRHFASAGVRRHRRRAAARRRDAPAAGARWAARPRVPGGGRARDGRRGAGVGAGHLREQRAHDVRRGAGPLPRGRTGLPGPRPAVGHGATAAQVRAANWRNSQGRSSRAPLPLMCTPS